jgi:hypothetical protein
MTPNSGDLRAISLWLAHTASLLPGGIIAMLFSNASSVIGHMILSAALTWCVAAFACSNALAAWHFITKHFSDFTLATAITIAAIIGPVIGLFATIFVESLLAFGIAFGCAILGALQGAAVFWLIAGPDLQSPPVWQDDFEEGDDDDAPNPLKRAP